MVTHLSLKDLEEVLLAAVAAEVAATAAVFRDIHSEEARATWKAAKVALFNAGNEFRIAQALDPELNAAAKAAAEAGDAAWYAERGLTPKKLDRRKQRDAARHPFFRFLFRLA